MRVLMEKALPLIRVRHTSLLDMVRWSSQAEQPTLHLVYASTEPKAPPLCVRQGKVQAHLSGYPSELRGHM